MIYKKRTDFIVDALKSIAADAHILDIGFVGEYAEPDMHYQILMRAPATAAITGIDISEEKINHFLSLPRTQELIVGRTTQYSARSIYETTFSENSFDCVFLLEVFEHLDKQDAALAEIARILKPGGVLVMTYPNPLSLDRCIRYFFAKNPLDPTVIKKIKGAEDHINFPHAACTPPLLLSKGLTVTNLSYINFRFKNSNILEPFMMRWRVTQKMSSYIGVVAKKI